MSALPLDGVGRAMEQAVPATKTDAAGAPREWNEAAAAGRILDLGIQYNVKFVSVPDGLGGVGFVPRLFSKM